MQDDIDPGCFPRSPCPLACTLDILGDRWTLLIVRDLFLGHTHFKEFAASAEGISHSTLAGRLHRLVQAGIAERFRSEAHPREGYRLTERGRSLEPVLTAITAWGLDHIGGTELSCETDGATRADHLAANA